MDIKALRYFVEVVDRQSFTHAADALHVTQPTISKMVRQLEDELGMPLLRREGKQFQLTDAGRVTLERGREALALMRRLRAELDELTELRRGELTLGVPPMVGGALFAPVIGAFRTRYPGVTLQLMEDGAQAIEEAMRAGRLELGLGLLPVDEAEFEHYAVIHDPLCLVAPAGSAWQGAASVTLAQIADQPFVLFTDDFALPGRIASAFRTLGRPLHIVSRSAHWDFIAELVAAGLGVTLLPRSVARRLQDRPLDIVPLDDAELQWKPALIWRRDVYLSQAARAMIDLTRQLLTNQASGQ